MPDRFPSPFEVVTPTGAEGWEELYGYSTVFSEDRRELEESMFWFMDGVHTPEVIEPWDATVLDFALTFLGQYTTRHYVIPPALGVDIRYLNGHMYLSPVRRHRPRRDRGAGAGVRRAGRLLLRATGPTLYDAWMDKIKGVIAELEAIDFQPLPHREDMAVITEGRGIGSGQLMMFEYDKLVQLTAKLWAHHFEFLNLGYAAYLDFFGFCKQVWPSIPDQAIAKMVAGIDVDLFRPDEELKKLAQLAVDLGVGDRITSDAARHAGRDGRRRGRQAVGRRVGGVAQPVVQLLLGLGLLPLGQDLGRVPRHPDGLHRVLRREAAAGASRWPVRSRRSRPSATGSSRSTPS